MCQNLFLYFISTLLTTGYHAFGFTLDIQIKVCFGLYILSCNTFFFIFLYLLLITVHRPAFGLTLDINKEKYTKLSVVLFPVVLRVANFLLSLFCSVVSLLCRKPVVRIFSTNYARSFFFYGWQFGGVVLFVVFVCIKLLGNVVRVYPKIIQGLTFLSA